MIDVIQAPAADHVIRPHAGPQEAFLACSADIAIYGGAAGGGKTWALLMEPLRHIDNENFGAVILRKTYPEIRNEGALWDESADIYSRIGADPKMGELSWTFPSGCKVQFGHLGHEIDKYKWQGSQIPLICFDELTHFSSSQFFYLLSRNRSTCGIRPYVRATCNPDADSWVAEFVAWWIDPDTGFAIPERAGVVRWFIRVAGQLIWGDCRAELIEEHPTSEPKSVAFIPARLEDNPTLIELDPGYLANLQALPHVDRERLLAGNWKIRQTDGAEFPTHYFDDLWHTGPWPGAFDASTIAIDPSLGKLGGDTSAIVSTSLLDGLIYVDADIERRPTPQLVADGIEMANCTAHLTAFGIEANAYQELLAPEFDRQCTVMGRLPLPIHLLHNTQSKLKIRLRRIAPYLLNKKLRFRRGSEGCETLERQLRGFPLRSVHDDGPDALEMALRLLDWVVTGNEPRDSAYEPSRLEAV